MIDNYWAQFQRSDMPLAKWSLKACSHRVRLRPLRDGRRRP